MPYEAHTGNNSNQINKLNLRVLNAETGDGIPSIQLDLYRNDRRVASTRSDSDGRAAFAPLHPGEYRVVQASFPKQMTGISAKPVVRIDDTGSMHLGNEPVKEIRMLNFSLRHDRS